MKMIMKKKRKKGKLRFLCVKGKLYKWIVDEIEVRIYDENKIMKRIEKWELTDGLGHVMPLFVRNYIKNNY